MKTFPSVSILALSVLCFANLAAARTVGSGKVVSETRDVSNYHGVELAGVGELTITQDDKESLVVEAEDNIVPLIETTVKPDGTLWIGWKGGSVQPTRPVIFKLSVKTLDRLKLSGSGSIRAEKISSTSATVALPGSGNIVIDHLATGPLTVALEGSGNIKLGGEAANQSVQLSGSGGYEAGGLKTEAGMVTLSGSGECKLWAEKTLMVNLDGSGEVGYYGNPAVVKNVRGSGEIRALGEKTR